MENLILYMEENQFLFFVIVVTLILAITIILLFSALKGKKKSEIELKDDFSKKKEEVLDTIDKMDDIVSNNTTILDEEKESFNEIDSLLSRMEDDIEEERHEEKEFSFEDFQEENAIISYEELLRASKMEPIISAEEEESQPMIMSVRELEAMRNKEIEEVIEEEPVKEEISGKFKNSDFISPIYGKINSNLDYPKIPSFKKQENTFSKPKETVPSDYNLDDFDRERKKNEDFLNELKDFRRNL